MNHLLLDTLRFLQENFDENTSWTITASQMRLKKKTVKEESITPVVTPKAEAPLFLKKPLSPSYVDQKNKPLPIPLQNVEKEIPKPTIQTSPLKVESLSEAIKGLFPQFTTHIEAPKDKDLRVNPVYKRVLQSDVVIFSFREGKESDLFLQNISLAIQSHFSSAAVFDVKKWEISEGNFELFFKQIQAKLFISSESIYKKPSLLPFLKEIPSSSERFLGPSRLLLLHPFETYFNNPLKKKDLWKILCATMKKTHPLQG